MKGIIGRKVMIKGEQLEMDSTRRIKKTDKKKKSEVESGRKSILILLLATTLISLLLYLKNQLSGKKLSFPKFNIFQSETITFEK